MEGEGNAADKDSLHSALSQLTFGVLITDCSGKITYGNEAAAKLVGVQESGSGVLNSSLEELLYLFDAEENRFIHHITQKTMDTGSTIRYARLQLLPRNGQRMAYVSLRSSPVGGGAGITGAVIELSECPKHEQLEFQLKEERANLLQSFMLAPIGLLVLDRHYELVMVNHTVRMMLNLQDSAPVGSKFGQAANCPNSRAAGCGANPLCTICQVQAHSRQVIDTQESVYGVVFQHIVVDKVHGARRIWFKASFVPYYIQGSIHVMVMIDDITQQKDQEDRMKLALEHYELLLEHFPMMVWKSGKDKKCEYTNEHWVSFTGGSTEQFLGFGWTEFIHPEDRIHVLQQYKDHFDSRRGYRNEYRMLRKDGSYRWILDYGQPYFDRGGAFAGYIGTALDITDRKAAEDVLQKYRFLSEETMEVILFIDPSNGRILEANRAAERIYGYSKEELLGLTIHALRLDHSGVHDQLEEAAQGKIRFSTVHVRKNGTTLPVEVSSKGAILGGKQIVLSIVWDLSEHRRNEKALRESEEKFRDFFYSSKEAMFIQEYPQGKLQWPRITEVNDAACTMFGYSRDEFLGMCLYELDIEYKTETSDAIIFPNKHIVERTFLTKNKQKVVVEMYLQHYERDGLVLMVAGIRDITESTRVKLELMEAKEYAEAANRTKSEFLANMSHEIRTPLNGMLGMIDLTLLSTLNADQRDNLTTAKSCANSLLNVINDILDFSKMEAGKLEIQHVEFNLHDLLRDVIKPHSLSAKEKKLELEYSVSPGLPGRLMGDPHRLQQVLNNLIHNAVKFTHEGRIDIRVQEMNPKDGKVHLLFEVLDTGIGISADQHGQLFQPFNQVEGSITRTYGGTGLGLSICKKLVERMGGVIGVDSQIGSGSKFHFVLSFPKAAGQPPLEPGRPEWKPFPKAIRPLRVLLAEDDKVNQKIMDRILSESGHQVILVQNGWEAVQQTARSSFDIILLDVQMPVMSGLEAIKLIRHQEAKSARAGKPIHTPVVAITAYALHGDREKMLAMGVDGYLTKPIDMDELFGWMNHVATGMWSGAPPAGEASSVKQEETAKADGYMRERLENLIKHLNADNYSSNFEQIEGTAHAIKLLADETGLAGVKRLAFKIELSARKGNFADVLAFTLEINREFQICKEIWI